MSLRPQLRCTLLLVCALVVSCRAPALQVTGDPEADLANSDPRVRIAAALQVVEEGRRDLAYRLVENLSDRDEAVRFYTSIAVRKVTGMDFGFKAYDDIAERARAIQRWQEWLESIGQAQDEPALPPEEPRGESYRIDDGQRSEPAPTNPVDHARAPHRRESASSYRHRRVPPRVSVVSQSRLQCGRRHSSG